MLENWNIFREGQTGDEKLLDFFGSVDFLKTPLHSPLLWGKTSLKKEDLSERRDICMIIDAVYERWDETDMHLHDL